MKTNPLEPVEKVFSPLHINKKKRVRRARVQHNMKKIKEE